MESRTRQRTRAEAVKEELKTLDAYCLRDVVRIAERQLKKIAREQIGDGPIEAETIDLLEFIWDLDGDEVWDSARHGTHIHKDVREKFYEREIERYLGRKVHHVWGTGEVARLKNGLGFGIRVRIKCPRCQKTKSLYARPGCHVGAFCYFHDEYGNFKFDFRNQVWRCC